MGTAASSPGGGGAVRPERGGGDGTSSPTRCAGVRAVRSMSGLRVAGGVARRLATGHRGGGGGEIERRGGGG